MWSFLYSLIAAQLRVRVAFQSNYVILVVLRVKKGNWKPYQQDREGLELIQRLQDPVTARLEYWGECSPATLPESVQEKEENKGWSANNIIEQRNKVFTWLWKGDNTISVHKKKI